MRLPQSRSELYGNVAEQYVTRPSYPEELFAWLSKQVAVRDCVWDAGCGSGQASEGLARHFERVIATDISAEQVQRGRPNPRVKYLVSRAEASGLASKSADLIFAGMAAHWFDLPAFYAEVRRVAKPGAIVALMVYGEPELPGSPAGSAMNALSALIEPYGPPEIRLVRDGYKSLFFPFRNALPLPSFSMSAKMKGTDFSAYLRTRASVRDYTAQNQEDPVLRIESILHEIETTDDGETLAIRWPLQGRLARL